LAYHQQRREINSKVALTELSLPTQVIYSNSLLLRWQKDLCYSQLVILPHSSRAKPRDFIFAIEKCADVLTHTANLFDSAFIPTGRV